MTAHIGPVQAHREIPGMVTVTCDHNHIIGFVPVADWETSVWATRVREQTAMACDGTSAEWVREQPSCVTCGKQIPERCPSDDFCTLKCQTEWHQQDKDLIDFNAQDAIRLLQPDVAKAQAEGKAAELKACARAAAS